MKTLPIILTLILLGCESTKPPTDTDIEVELPPIVDSVIINPDIVVPETDPEEITSEEPSGSRMAPGFKPKVKAPKQAVEFCERSPDHPLC